MFFECRCVACGALDGPVCADCESGLFEAEVARSAALRARFMLDERMRAIVVALKYQRERRLGAWAARAVTPLVPQLADVVTWVPATPERVRWRGYDQSREIATRVAASLGMVARPLLVRTRGDQRQTARNRRDRLQGPMLHASKRRASGLVVLVDDVVTTGATMHAARDALLSSGAERVVAVALARTPLSRPDR